MKTIKMFSVLAIVAGLAVSCGELPKASAKIPFGFIEVTKDGFTDGNVTVVQHITTGCYYAFMDGPNSGAFTQMFVEKNGASVPYCDKKETK